MAIMYALGQFIFSSSTIVPKEVDRADNYAWESVPRSGREPARQAKGKGDSTIAMNGAFYPCDKGNAWTLDILREQADAMKPLLLISMASDTQGWAGVRGRYTVDNITEKDRYLWPNGTPRKIEFSLALTRYGEDR